MPALLPAGDDHQPDGVPAQPGLVVPQLLPPHSAGPDRGEGGGHGQAGGEGQSLPGTWAVAGGAECACLGQSGHC